MGANDKAAATYHPNEMMLTAPPPCMHCQQPSVFFYAQLSPDNEWCYSAWCDKHQRLVKVTISLLEGI